MNRNRNSNSFFRQRNDRSTSETLKAPSLYEHYLRYGSARRGFDNNLIYFFDKTFQFYISHQKKTELLL